MRAVELSENLAIAIIYGDYDNGRLKMQQSEGGGYGVGAQRKP